MAHGFVQQDAGGAGAHHHGHLAALGAAGREALVDALDSLAGKLFQQSVRQHLRTHAEAARDGLGLYTPVLGEYHRSYQAAHGTRVVFHLLEGVEHQDVAHLRGEHGYDLDDASVPGPDEAFKLLEQGKMCGNVGSPPVHRHGVTVRGGIGPAEVPVVAGAAVSADGAAGGDGRRRTGRGPHGGRIRTLRIRIAGLLAAQHADTYSVVDVESSGGDFSVPQQYIAV